MLSFLSLKHSICNYVEASGHSEAVTVLKNTITDALKACNKNCYKPKACDGKYIIRVFFLFCVCFLIVTSSYKPLKYKCCTCAKTGPNCCNRCGITYYTFAQNCGAAITGPLRCFLRKKYII